MSKIVQINSSSEAGGGPQVMWDIIEGLDGSFAFFVIAPGGVFLEKYKKVGLPLEAIRDKNFISIVLQIRRVIKKENPSIIHLHGTRTAIWGRLAVIGLKDKPKIVYTLHGFHILRRNIFLRFILLRLERFLNRWTNILICVSQADKDLVLKHRALQGYKIRIIRNGINIQRFQAQERGAEKTKEQLGLEGSFIISSVGRLHPQKDFSTLLKAFRIVLDRIKNIKLLIIGDGPLRQKLEQESESLGIERFVKFLGARKDMPALLNASDIVVLSTNWEGLPLIPLEAGASRKPVVASDVGGVREVVKHGETGYLFRPGSEKDLADKIFVLYNSSDLRRKMGEEGFSFISKFFSKERMAEEHKKLYQTLLF